MFQVLGIQPCLLSMLRNWMSANHRYTHSLKQKATAPENRTGPQNDMSSNHYFWVFVPLSFKEGTKHLLRYKGSGLGDGTTNGEQTTHQLWVSHQKDGFSIPRTSLNEPPTSTASNNIHQTKGTQNVMKNLDKKAMPKLFLFFFGFWPAGYTKGIPGIDSLRTKKNKPSVEFIILYQSLIGSNFESYS